MFRYGLAGGGTVLAGAAMLLAVCGVSVGVREYVGVGVVSHSGYSGCIELANERTRVVLCPACGGRVLEYSLGGRNVLYLDPKQNGWVYNSGRQIDPWGGRLDIGPEKMVPKHPDLWLGRWKGEITGDRKARLTSVKDEATGVQLVRDFELDAKTSKLLCRQTIRNISGERKYYCHWSRTMALGNGIVLAPLSEPRRFPAGYVMYGPGSSILFNPKDRNIRIRGGFVEVLGPPAEPKLGMDSHAGWFCYLTRNDLMFLKRYPTYPERAYNEIAALTISIWYNGTTMCELEPIGPMEVIEPGQSASFAEQWYLFDYDFPGEGEDADLDQVTSIAERSE